jgi:NADPH:quinone reductase-like Zn-dependent oxidoreductase
MPTTTTTRMYRFHRYSGPEILRLVTGPLPEPGYGEVRLSTQAAGKSSSRDHNQPWD